MIKNCTPIIIAFFVHITFLVNAQNNCGEESQQIYFMMEKHHIMDISPDDSLSISVYDEILEALDPYGLIFLQSDIDSLSKFTYAIDDEIMQKSEEFYLSYSHLFKMRSLEMLEVLEEIELADIALNQKDTLFYYSEPTIYSHNKKDRKKRYQRYLKMEVLNELFDKESSEDTIFNILYEDANKLCSSKFQEIKMREKRQLVYYHNHSMGYENIMQLLYLNTITSYYDPHSMYFNTELNKWFQGKANASTYSFGFTLEEDFNGKVKVSSLIPGGSAWKTNAIHKGDVLIAGTWKGSSRQDFTLLGIDEIEDFLEQSIDKRFTLELRKANGEFFEIELKKEIIQEDEDIVHSYILESDYKMGLITLPSFYSDYDENISGCSDDVAREIMKLKKEGIEGLILDLRFNGGGSVTEAVDLAGIFVDAGPICILSDNIEKPYSIKDRNRGTIWDGPLVILVNGYSASASEILAAALQDYNRAIIVGQNTYGKASAQVVIPLDTCINKNLSNLTFRKKDKTFIKLTKLLIYHINGESNQRRGVSPDIVFPSYYEPQTEKDKAHAIANIPISKKSYYTPMPSLPIDSIRDLYYERSQKETWYKNVKKVKDTTEKLLDVEYHLFDFESWQTYKRELLQLQENYLDKLEDFEHQYSISNHSYNQDLIESDDFFRISNEASHDRIRSDHEILDAIFILEKLIKLK
jgi:carboxyl-terminal processing protease